MSWSVKPHFIKACTDPEELELEAKSMIESDWNLSVRLQGMRTQPEANETLFVPVLALFKKGSQFKLHGFPGEAYIWTLNAFDFF